MTIDPNSIVTALISLKRLRVGAATKTFDFPVTIESVGQFVANEQIIPAGATLVPLSFGNITTARAVILYSPQPVHVRVNGNTSGQVKCGSFQLFFDTIITSMFIDNDLLSPVADVQVEVWIAE